MSSSTSSASLGWRGNEAAETLQALAAQVKKLRLRSFILGRCRSDFCSEILSASRCACLSRSFRHGKFLGDPTRDALSHVGVPAIGLISWRT